MREGCCECRRCLDLVEGDVLSFWRAVGWLLRADLCLVLGEKWVDFDLLIAAFRPCILLTMSYYCAFYRLASSPNEFCALLQFCKTGLNRDVFFWADPERFSLFVIRAAYKPTLLDNSRSAGSPEREEARAGECF